MTRLTRLTRILTFVNSPESHLLITGPLRRNPTLRSLAGVSFLKHTRTPQRQFSTASNPDNSFTTSSGRRKLDPLPSARDSDETHPPESDAPPAEYFVTVDYPSPNPDIESLDESVVCADDDRSVDVSANEEGEADHRKVLPEELLRSVMMLSCESSAEGGNCDVYLVGTAHVSVKSCQEVQALISFLKPQVVFLELCSSRVAVLTRRNLKVPTMREMVDMWKKKNNIFGILYSWFLAEVANKLEVVPGSEFRVAYEEATKYGGKVILGDRPVHITLQRTWGKMPLWHKTKLLYSLLFQAFFLPSSEDLNKMVKEIDNFDMATLFIQEMSKEFPTLVETIVHERDQYMSSTLLRVASENSSVVAVVGKGHLQGIKKHWKQPVEMKDLMDVPSQKKAVSAAKILSTLGVAVAGVAIISGIYLSSKK